MSRWRVFTWLVTLARHLAQNELLVLASAIAYAGMFSVFPFLIAVIALFGLFVDQWHVQQAVDQALRPYLPPDALRLVGQTLDAVVRSRGTVGFLAAVMLLWAGTAMTSALRQALNRVLGAVRPRAYWHRKLIELAMVVMGGAFIGVSVLTSGLLEAAQSLRPLAAVTAAIRRSQVVALLAGLGPWIFSGAAFFVVYRFLPNVRMSRRSLLAGTLTAMVLFEVTKRGFFWFLATVARFPLVYGPLAGVMVLMVWLYLVALLVLVGAEVIWLVERPASA